MLVTLPGMVMLVRPQPANAESPILVTLFGIVIFVGLPQPANAEAPMLVTLPSVGITLFLHPIKRVFEAISIRQFSAER